MGSFFVKNGTPKVWEESARLQIGLWATSCDVSFFNWKEIRDIGKSDTLNDNEVSLSSCVVDLNHKGKSTTFCETLCAIDESKTWNGTLRDVKPVSSKTNMQRAYEAEDFEHLSTVTPDFRSVADTEDTVTKTPSSIQTPQGERSFSMNSVQLQTPSTGNFQLSTPSMSPVVIDARLKMSTIRGTPIQVNDDWPNVLEKFLFTGWHYKSTPKTISGWYIVPPMAQNDKDFIRNGKEGIDFFASEDQLRYFAVEHFGWAGDKQYRKYKFDRDMEKCSSGRTRRPRIGAQRVSLNSSFIEEEQSTRKRKKKVPSSRNKKKATKVKNHTLDSKDNVKGTRKKAREETMTEKKTHTLISKDNEKGTRKKATEENTTEEITHTLVSIDNEKGTRKKAREENMTDEKGLSIRARLNRAMENLHPSCDASKEIPGTQNSCAVKLGSHCDEVQKLMRDMILRTDSDENHAVDDSAADCIYLCGGPGTGKTTLVQLCCNDVEKWAKENKNLVQQNKYGNWSLLPKMVYINVTHLKDASSMNTSILSHLSSILGIGEPSSFQDIENHIDIRKSRFKKSAIVLVLDEIDLIVSSSSGSKVLEKLFHWSSNPVYSFLLIGISNSIENKQVTCITRLYMSAANKELKKLVFKPYSTDDLVRILQHRVGTFINSGALNFAARKISAHSGDARRVLELAQSAIRKCMSELSEDVLERVISDDDASSTVSIKHMMRAIKEKGGVKHSESIAGLPSAAKTVLCVAVTLGRCNTGNTLIQQSALHQWCVQASRHGVFEFLGEDHFSDLLSQLSDAGLLMIGDDNLGEEYAQQEALDGQRLLCLNVQLDDVECALEKTLHQDQFYRAMVSRVQDTVKRNEFE